MREKAAKERKMKQPPIVADRSEGRDNNFNLLRVFAAAGVLVSHAFVLSLGSSEYEPLTQWLGGKSLGSISVLVFFAISGFFITRSFDRRNSLWGFFQARIFRIFPALAIVLLLTIPISGLFFTTSPQDIFWPAAFGYFFHNISLFSMQYNLPGVFEANPYGSPINGSLWTLSYEVLCYLGVVICGLLGLLSRPRIFAVGIFVFLVVYGVTVIGDIHPRIDKLMYLGLPFLTGMSFYLWRDSLRLSFTAAFGLALLAALLHSTPLFLPAFTVALSYAVFVIGYAQNSLFLNYNRLGDYSYGLYIYAFPVQQIIASTGNTVPAINIALALPISLLCSVISWHIIEAPAMNYGRSISRRGYRPNKELS